MSPLATSKTFKQYEAFHSPRIEPNQTSLQGAWLFWGDKRVEIAAIQILPVTPVNEELYDAEWVQNMVNYASGELADASSGDEWRSVIFLAYSNYDPHKAAKLSTLLTNWGSGNSYSNQVCEDGCAAVPVTECVPPALLPLNPPQPDRRTDLCS